jgi:hypothetical protein
MGLAVNLLNWGGMRSLRGLPTEARENGREVVYN